MFVHVQSDGHPIRTPIDGCPYVLRRNTPRIVTSNSGILVGITEVAKRQNRGRCLPDRVDWTREDFAPPARDPVAAVPTTSHTSVNLPEGSGSTVSPALPGPEAPTLPADGDQQVGTSEFTIPPNEYNESGRLRNPENYFESPAWRTAISDAGLRVPEGDEASLTTLVSLYSRWIGDRRLAVLENIWFTTHPRAADFVLGQFQDQDKSIRLRCIGFARDVATSPEQSDIPVRMHDWYHDARSVRSIHLELIERFQRSLLAIVDSDPEEYIRTSARRCLDSLEAKRKRLLAGEDFGLADYRQ